MQVYTVVHKTVKNQSQHTQLCGMSYITLLCQSSVPHIEHCAECMNLTVSECVVS